MFFPICGVLLGGFLVGSAVAPAATSLRTRQIVLQLQAAPSPPRLVSLQVGGATPWENVASEDLIQSALLEGHPVSLHWQHKRGVERVDAGHVIFVYEAASPHLRLTWEWIAKASNGPIEHRIRIENLDNREVWIPPQPSFTFRFRAQPQTALVHMYVDKGAGRPSSIGTHFVPVPPLYHWKGVSSTYATDEGPREIIPFSLLQRTEYSGHGREIKDGWYVGVEFSGRTSLTLDRKEGIVSGRVGLDPDPVPSWIRLSPNGQFAAPPVFLGAFRGDADDAGNVLRPWVRQVLANPTTWANPHYPLLVNNSWGSGMAIDEAVAKRMIRDSAELGMEMFHLDAGWFRSVGDWYPDPKKFPSGLAALSKEAHALGLRFGIWVNWAEAGVANRLGALNINAAASKDLLVADAPKDWRPEPFVGRTIDLGAPSARHYAEGELERIVSSYKLDMLEHDGYVVARACARVDHPHAPPPSSYPAAISGSGVALPFGSNSTDVSYRATLAYYALYGELRRRHPSLLLEICNDGGRMVDFGSASHGDYFSITDSYDPVSNRQAFFDASHLLPPAMLEDYVEKWPTPTMESFRYMLRSGMMGWLTIMQATNAWTPEQQQAAKQEFTLYKSKLRPFIRDADLFHVSQRPDGVHWDATEYVNSPLGRGVLYAFRGSNETERTHRFQLRGLQPGKLYRLHFQDHSSGDATVRGTELLTEGLEVSLPHPNSSELIFFQRIDGAPGSSTGVSAHPFPR